MDDLIAMEIPCRLDDYPRVINVHALRQPEAPTVPPRWQFGPDGETYYLGRRAWPTVARINRRLLDSHSRYF